MGQERVTIGNELAGLFLAVQGQFFNDDTQVGQTFVDVIGLFEPLPSGSSFGLSLRACQIDDVKLGIDHLSSSGFLVVDGEDCVTARAVFVHGMGSDDSDLLAVLEDPLNFLVRLA